jgi:hypothetical protein
MKPKGLLPRLQEPSKSEVLCVMSCFFFFFCSELLACHQTPKLEGHLLLTVQDCLFTIFPASHINVVSLCQNT